MIRKNLIESEDAFYIIHTEIDKIYLGQGIAKKLVERVIEEAKKYNKILTTECSYAIKIIKQ